MTLNRFYGHRQEVIQYKNEPPQESPRFRGIIEWMLIKWLIATEKEWEAIENYPDSHPRKAENLKMIKELARELHNHIRYIDPDFEEGGG